ncbi:energy transducer TonB [Mucilaginibacter gotjawali]|uniref:Uncharacterized protein n=2 Tax=Mucilaginibacter gotjawali TaxID=1550579 RepID=A0A839SES7_9SPHI|nr:energy transducer TonB [Mucilaginibacter gotjawali]MBB3055794.1 hypothetical protein [Mucilaginibacter gotjawali]BAU54615.1 Gram-negative bacterial tonB protein [Mucilaginibacter gotjawali]
MKTFLITTLLFLSFIGVKAQTTLPPPPPTPPDVDIQEKADTSKQAWGEYPPEFPGGIDKFFSFLKKKIRLPYLDDNLRGRVIASFVIEKDGSLTQIKIARGLRQDIDDAVIKVLSLSPKWKPGMQNGKPVRVAYSIPVPIPFNDF